MKCGEFFKAEAHNANTCFPCYLLRNSHYAKMQWCSQCFKVGHSAWAHEPRYVAWLVDH